MLGMKSLDKLRWDFAAGSKLLRLTWTGTLLNDKMVISKAKYCCSQGLQKQEAQILELTSFRGQLAYLIASGTVLI